MNLRYAEQLKNKSDKNIATWEPDIYIRVQGRDSKVWKGKIRQESLPSSEAKEIPMALSNKAGGPIPVKATEVPNQLVPQAQQFLVYIDVLDADATIFPGCMAQAKIYLQPETCAQWLWRLISDLFDIGLVR
jgi:putative peptide zinc metalloprotease protein